MADDQKIKPKSENIPNSRKEGRIPELGGSKKEKINTGNFRQKKRPAFHAPKNENDVYVNARSDFQGQLKKVLKLFEEGSKEVVVHGLGHAVTAAANLSLQIKDKLNNTVELSVATDSVELQDEWEPVVDSELPFSSTRTNPAIHIIIRRVPEFPPN